MARQPRYPARPAAGLRGRGHRRARHRPAGRPGGSAAGHRPPRRSLRARPHRDAVGPVLRVRHRRHAPGGPGRRLAGQRLDQNAGLLLPTPALAAVENVAKGWLLDVLGLPAASGVGFVTGATMSNFTCLAAARDAVLHKAGWQVAADGLTGAPRVRVLVGAERHNTVDLALRYLGLGAPEVVAADDQGRIDPGALEAALAAGPETPSGPAIVVVQAGNVHSGAFDPFGPAIEAAHRHGAWVHVDGAFGLFAAASPRTRHLVAGYEAADSWTTDAHKTLNVPYDCGIAIVRDVPRCAPPWACTGST